jgi:hypothetical protein
LAQSRQSATHGCQWELKNEVHLDTATTCEISVGRYALLEEGWRVLLVDVFSALACTLHISVRLQTHGWDTDRLGGLSLNLGAVEREVENRFVQDI